MAAAEALLKAEGITRLFGGVRALEGVDVTVRRGSVHGLIGPNGAGKTTLLNLIAGVFPPSAGSLQFGTQDITRLSAPRRARLGIRRTFQNLKLFLEMTALENVAIGLHADTRCGFLDAVLRLPRQRREESGIMERAMQALSFVGLADVAHARSSTLAYGHRRLLEIARSIVSSPHLLLLDEPAAGLNATESAQVTRLITQLRDGGVTILLVEHHMDVVMSACDEITVLNYGRKLAHGRPSEVQNNNAVIEAYLGRSMDDPRACA
jgi:ABC-type branched-subunit amino acid transport system ATPase component